MPPVLRSIVAIQDPPEAGRPARVRILPGVEAVVSAFDRSFHFGDSIYEVARTYGGILFSLGEHLERLHESARLARFDPPPDAGLVEAMIRDACHAFFRTWGDHEVYVRATVSRGVGDLQIDRRSAGPPYVLVIVKDLGERPAGIDEQGVHWWLVERRRNLRSALDPAMKSGNYLNNVLALAEAQAEGADDALMLDHDGCVTEGTTSNFYAVIDGCVWTAPPEVGILRGVTRGWLLQAAHELGIPLQERRFGLAELGRANELFLSSSTREVQLITCLSGRTIGDGRPGPLARRLHAGLRERIDRYCHQHRAASLFLAGAGPRA